MRSKRIYRVYHAHSHPIDMHTNLHKLNERAGEGEKALVDWPNTRNSNNKTRHSCVASFVQMHAGRWEWQECGEESARRRVKERNCRRAARMLCLLWASASWSFEVNSSSVLQLVECKFLHSLTRSPPHLLSLYLYLSVCSRSCCVIKWPVIEF